MPVRPRIEPRRARFRLTAEMRDETPLVEGRDLAVGHDQRRVKIPVVDGLQGIDVETGCAIDQAVHCRADGLLRVRGSCHGVCSCGRQVNGRGGVRPDRGALPAAEGDAADDVVAVEPAMLERRRDMARGDRQHAVGEPHVHLGGQVLERLSGLGEDRRHPDPEPLHGVAAEIGLGPADGDHQRGQRVERGMAEMRGLSFQPPDRVRQRRGPVDQADCDAQQEQGEQRHPDRDMQVEQELLQRGILRDQRRHGVAAAPHEDEADGHDPVHQARGQVVLFIGHRRRSLLSGPGFRVHVGAGRRICKARRLASAMFDTGDPVRARVRRPLPPRFPPDSPGRRNIPAAARA